MDPQELQELQQKLAAAKARLVTVRELHARALACVQKAAKEARHLQGEVMSLTIQIFPADLIAEANAERIARGEQPLEYQPQL